MTEREAMERALALAREGWGHVAPNPLVGAVLLRDGRVIGEGYHAAYGGPHAEVAALAACTDPAKATCVVTLEPCTHHGKTTPCVDALIAADVRRVVFAVGDPHREAGGGAGALRGAGIDVDSGVCGAEAAALNAPFLFAQTHADRPFVALKVATSLDGFLADATGRSRWISGAEAQAYVHWLRAGFDAIAVGRRTADLDDPALTVRGTVTPRVSPIRVVFSRSGRLDPTRQLARTANDMETVLLARPDAAPDARTSLRQTAVRVVEAGTTSEALAALRSLGIESLLVEGGGCLAGELLTQGAVDRIYWIQAPLWLREGTYAFGRGPAVLLEEAARWTPVERKRLGDDTLLVVDRELCLRGS